MERTGEREGRKRGEGEGKGTEGGKKQKEVEAVMRFMTSMWLNRHQNE